MKLGSDIGIIAYNDAPFKEILAGGITVLSTDFAKMGETTARMIQTKSKKLLKPIPAYRSKFYLILFTAISSFQER